MRDVDAPLALDDLQHLIEQHGSRQDGKIREVTGKCRVIYRDLDRAMHHGGERRVHGDSFACR